MPFVYYTNGILNNCNIKFDGNTGDINSNAHIQFTIANSVHNYVFVVQVQYSTYFSSNIHLTTYNSLTNLAMCGLSVNGTLLTPTYIPASIQTNSQLLTCTFALATPYISTPNDNIILHLSNIANPITSTIYSTNI
jgi:hypothetical protein